MEILRQFQGLAWCKPDWCFPSMSKETNELLRQCAEGPEPSVSDDIEEVIKKSRAFPAAFPVETIRLHSLKETVPIEKLKRNIVSTYPIIHERVLLLITHFLIFKREFGTSIEKSLYKDMTVPEFVDRLLKKRALVFMSARDYYKLITGEEDEDGWESVGTLQQRPPLTLDKVLSYDEMKISSMLYVSGRTAFVNDGARTNGGIVADGAEKDGVIIGLIGARLKRKHRMEYEDLMITEQQNSPENGYGEEENSVVSLLSSWCLIGPRLERKHRMEYEDLMITEEQNSPENGYGEEVTPTTCLNVLKTTYVRNNQSTKHLWRQMWSEFYQVHSYTYEELTSYVDIKEKADEKQKYTDRYVRVHFVSIFDNEVYYKRLSIPFECALLEANERAREDGTSAFLNIIGIGLGVWRTSDHQHDVFILTFLERLRYFLKKDLLNHISDVNFAYIRPSQSILALFKQGDAQTPSEKRIFYESKRHPNGGINVQLENREPSAELPAEHAGKLLVVSYPWDGNAHPGNEFWLGSLSGSGDPAAACSTQVAELHNAHINAATSGYNLRVVGSKGLHTLRDYCRLLVAS